MRLDRHLNANGKGKYALLKLRLVPEAPKPFSGKRNRIWSAIQTLEKAGILDWGDAKTESEFFLIRLKDKYANRALIAYAVEARADDPEYANEVHELAFRAGPNSPFCKKPD